MASREKHWESYEQVAAYLLDQVASALGLERVEGKQAIASTSSGTTWEIDGKGVQAGDSGFVIIECKRFTTSKVKQAHVATLAYSIRDAGAQGGIIVSPLGVQAGGVKIAAAENIQVVHMDQNSTRLDYFLEFLDRTFVGTSDSGHATDSAVVEIIEKPELPKT